MLSRVRTTGAQGIVGQNPFRERRSVRVGRDGGVGHSAGGGNKVSRTRRFETEKRKTDSRCTHANSVVQSHDQQYAQSPPRQPVGVFHLSAQQVLSPRREYRRLAVQQETTPEVTGMRDWRERKEEINRRRPARRRVRRPASEASRPELSSAPVVAARTSAKLLE